MRCLECGRDLVFSFRDEASLIYECPNGHREAFPDELIIHGNVDPTNDIGAYNESMDSA